MKSVHFERSKLLLAISIRSYTPHTPYTLPAYTEMQFCISLIYSSSSSLSSSDSDASSSQAMNALAFSWKRTSAL